ncbi:hypothetical protein ACI2KR_08325 [Pseudomonas luteola]
MTDTQKYDLNNLSHHQGMLNISEREFYQHTVAEEALSYLRDQEDAVKEMLRDGTEEFDRNHSDIERSFHETIVDRAYGETHARHIIDNCSNEETDDGLWEGLDEDDRLSTKAAYSYGNDVADEAESVYSNVYDAYQLNLESIDDALQGLQSGKVEFNPSDITHVVGVKAFMEYNEIVGNLQEGTAELMHRGALGEDLPTADVMEFSIEFSADLAIREQIDAPYFKRHPDPVEPGSLQEAAVLIDYLKAKNGAGFFGGYPMGHSYVDGRADPEIADRIFAEYVDARASALLGEYQEPTEHNPAVDEAKALAVALKATHSMTTPEIAYFQLNAKNAAPAEKENAASPFKAMLEVMEHKIKEGSVTPNDYKALGESRNKRDLGDASTLSKYFSTMHPETSRQYQVGFSMDHEAMAVLVAGLMDGSSKAQEQLKSLKADIDKKVYPAPKALFAFRKSFESKDLSVEGPSI